MSDKEKVFGQFLSAIAERDIDLLLLEEFHVSPEFVQWFGSAIREEVSEFLGAWHSISDSSGETDLLLLVRSRNQRVGILIENKVGAPEQDRQGERYHIRGKRGEAEGRFDRYLTCMCAPQNYLEKLPGDTVYLHRISYEDIGAWFGRQEDARSAWKAHLIGQAVEQSRRGYTMVVDPVKTQFHADYWEYRRLNFPDIQMARPGPKGPKSNWIVLKAAGFPKRVHLHHKLDQAVVELGFSGRSIAELRATGSSWPPGVVLEQKDGTAVLSRSVPVIDMSLGVAGQKASLEASFTVMKELMTFASILEDAP